MSLNIEYIDLAVFDCNLNCRSRILSCALLNPLVPPRASRRRLPTLIALQTVMLALFLCLLQAPKTELSNTVNTKCEDLNTR